MLTRLGKPLAAGVAAALALSQAPAADTLAITSVNVIDVSATTSATALLTNRTVVITGNRVTAIGDAASTAVPAGARQLDGRGKYLMPGLWDMHAHALTEHEWTFPLFVANGVTGIREMGTILPYDRINEIRRGLADGSIVGPRIGATTARILDGVGGRGGPMTPVATADDGRRIVREYKQNGIGFVKPYNLLERETYLAIVDEARRQGLPVSGHVPNSMTAAEASDAGQIGIEHMWDVFISSSRDEAALRQERLALAKNAPAGVFPRVESKAAATYDDGKASSLFARFAKNRTAVIPTMVFFEAMMKSGADVANDERLRYVPEPTRERWRQQTAQRPPGMAERQAPMQQKRLELVRSMHQQGVRLLTGTDLLNPYLFPGFSLHDELDWFTKAGLTPFDVLRIATIDAAQFLGRDSDLGSIRPGKLADAVLLDANPLQDIRRVRRIAAVIVDGRLYERAALDAMLAKTQIGATSIQYRSPSGVEYRSLPDTEAITKAKAALAAEPRSVARIVDLGVAQSGARQFREAIATFTRGLEIEPDNALLLRWRGHRYLSVREFDKAYADLTRGSGIDGSIYGIWYHLGIVQYVRGEFAAAAASFARAQPIAPDPGELAGSTDWLWMALSRAGRGAEAKAMLDRRPESRLPPIDNAYTRRLKLYRGELAPDDVLTAADTDDVQIATLLYGLGNWYVIRGDNAKARACFERAVRASGGWPGFGFILSEVELQRLPGR